MSNPIPIDTELAAPYPEDLYRFDQPGRYVERFDQLTEADFRQFEELGYLAVRQLLTPDEVADVLAGMASVLENPGEAMIQYESWAVDRIGSATGEERLDLIRKFMTFIQEDERLTALARHDKIVSIVRRLCGTPDISMMQDMALLKPPGGGREKPWHQDNAFFALEPGTPIVGGWLALDPATPENGCMHVLPGTHREGPVVHFRRRDWQVCDDQVDRRRDTMIPLPPGGALFFHGLLHHGTPTNRTDRRRRAIQLHYVPVGTPQISDRRRLDIFGSQGKDVTC